MYYHENPVNSTIKRRFEIEPPSISYLILQLEFRTSSNQSLTSFVTCKFSEVLDETSSQIFCFFFPFASTFVSVARVKDFRINTRKFCRNNKVEERNNLSRSFVNRTVKDSVNDTTSIFNRDTFAGTIPTCINQVCFSTSHFHLLHQFFCILSRVQ